MIICHSIGEGNHPNLNTIDEILAAPKDEIITFDGVYKSVWEHREQLKDRQLILFVMGDYIGRDNNFDEGRHHWEELCTLDQLQEIGGELAWHTWSHPDLTTLDDVELEYELTAPFQTDLFAYPYGRFDARVIEAVKKRFKKAFAVEVGDNSDYQITRRFL